MAEESGYTALVVENEALIALDISSALSENGFAKVHVASSPEKARAYLNEAPIHVALVDLHLGHSSDGIEIARALVERAVPTLFMTGYDHFPEGLPSALSKVGRLTKPFSGAQLLQQVAALLPGGARLG